MTTTSPTVTGDVFDADHSVEGESRRITFQHRLIPEDADDDS
jgi:hypothetical protein